MSNSTPTHSPKIIYERKKERKKKKQREKKIKRSDPLYTPRERDQKGQRTKGTVLTSEIANRPNLAPARDRGQRQR